jgi:hypothetical protein
MVGNGVKVMLGCVGILTVLAFFATQRIPEPTDPIRVDPADPVMEAQFDRAWSDVMVPMALKKADMERVRTIPLAKPVTTERVVPDQPVEEATEDTPAPRHRRRQKDGHNVCTRHGMKKVVTRGGKSWRCRK